MMMTRIHIIFYPYKHFVGVYIMSVVPVRDEENLSPTNDDIKQDLSTLNDYTNHLCVLSMSVFVLVIYLASEIPHIYSEIECHEIENDEKYISYMMLGGFVVVWIFVAHSYFAVFIDSNKDTSSSLQKTRFKQIIKLLLMIVSICVIDCILSVSDNFNFICKDNLGVYIPNVLWAEWISTGYLLYLIPFSIENQVQTKENILIMIGFELCMIFGFLIILPFGKLWGWLMFSLSIISYAPSIYLPYRNLIRENKVNHHETTNASLTATMYTIKRSMTIWLSVIFPFYTVVYVFAILEWLNKYYTISFFHILTLITKAIYVHIMFNLHTKHFHAYENEVQFLNRLVDARTNFVNYISHEIRNPLSSLSLSTDIICLNCERMHNEEVNSELLMQENQNCLHIIRNSINFMNETLNNILMIQQMENDRVIINLQYFSLEKCFKNILRMYDFMMRDKNIKLTFLYDSKIPKQVKSDEHRMSHIVSNILSNAIKFSYPNSEIIVKVHIIKQDHNYLTICTEVQDFGTGISQDVIENIGSKYLQERPGILKKGQGSGLGIHFVKKMIDILHGKLEIDSEINVGSTFKIILDYEILEEDMNQLQRINLGKETLENSIVDIDKISNKHTSIKNVLIVDDVESNIKILSLLLKKNDINVTCAYDGLQAINELKERVDNYFNLIFIDNLMPNMCGIDATKIIRNEIQYKGPIIGLTGNVSMNDVKIFLEAGVDIVIKKPIAMNTIQKILEFFARHISNPLRKYDIKNDEIIEISCKMP